MKKIHTLVGLVAICCLASLYSQAQGKKIRWGVQAGGTYATTVLKADGMSITNDWKVGMTGGIVANMESGNHLSYQTGLNFTQKGTSATIASFEEEELSSTATFNYLELPIQALYTTRPLSQGGFFAGGGPTFGFALGGKFKDNMDGEEVESDVSIGNGEDDDLKPFDLGLNLMAGYQFKNGLFLSGGYNMGLINVAPGSTDAVSGRNNYFSLKLGFLFGK